jgi:hypothetical protein
MSDIKYTGLTKGPDNLPKGTPITRDGKVFPYAGEPLQNGDTFPANAWVKNHLSTETEDYKGWANFVRMLEADEATLDAMERDLEA